MIIKIRLITLILQFEIVYIVVQILVINIGICFASSYNVSRADLKLLNRFFESVARENTLQQLEIRGDTSIGSISYDDMTSHRDVMTRRCDMLAAAFENIIDDLLIL